MPQLTTILARSLRLKCPCCGQGHVLRGWFGMPERCRSCGVVFEREAGFFLGPMLFNGALTTIVTAIAMPIFFITDLYSREIILACGFGFGILFPLLFFPWARSLWLGLDEYFDPRST